MRSWSPLRSQAASFLIRWRVASAVAVTHSALAKTVEKIFGLPILPAVAASNDFGDLFQTGMYP